MRHRIPGSWSGLFCLALLFALAGCTEDKALALQSAALQYRDQAVRALGLASDGLRAATAMPARTSDQLADDLDTLTRPLDAGTLDHLLTGETELARTADIATQPLNPLRDNVIAFSAIFDRLPQGSYLAQDAVKEAIPIAVRMNQSLLNLVAQIDAGTLRIVDNPRRIEIIEATNAARNLPPGAQRDKALRQAAGAMLELSTREQQRRAEAGASLLQAAEVGNTVIGLARNYGQLSLRDVLHSLNDALVLAGRISPDSQSIKRNLARLQGTTRAWEDDPVLKPLLAQPIARNE